MTTHTGGCHCGAVRFTVDMTLEKTLVCNCSHCHKKGFILSFVPTETFTLTHGEDMLTSYRFNKKHIDHVFCKQCGTQSFARGITFPQVAINVRCLDGVDTDTLASDRYNGKEV